MKESKRSGSRTKNLWSRSTFIALLRALSMMNSLRDLPLASAALSIRSLVGVASRTLITVSRLPDRAFRRDATGANASFLSMEVKRRPIGNFYDFVHTMSIHHVYNVITPSGEGGDGVMAVKPRKGVA
jgi:hypothetical protein